jgi:hypothetical protein
MASWRFGLARRGARVSPNASAPRHHQFIRSDEESAERELISRQGFVRLQQAVFELFEHLHRFGARDLPSRDLLGFVCAVCTDDHRASDVIVVCGDYRLDLKDHRQTPNSMYLN